MSTPYQWAQGWAKENKVALKARESTGSTNDDAKNDDAKNENSDTFTLYLANSQTAGRGRGSHQWLAKPGEALLSSWALNLTRAPQPILSPLVGLALFRSVRAVWPQLPLALKAPNDLCTVKGGAASKLAGLLIEVVSSGTQHRLVVGLGLNVLGAPKIDTTEPGSYPATSLLTESAAVNESRMFQFLNAFKSEFTQVLALISKADFRTLDTKQRSELKSALMAHPNFTDLVEVSENGDLIRKIGVTRWMDL